MLRALTLAVFAHGVQLYPRRCSRCAAAARLYTPLRALTLAVFARAVQLCPVALLPLRSSSSTCSHSSAQLSGFSLELSCSARFPLQPHAVCVVAPSCSLCGATSLTSPSATKSPSCAAVCTFNCSTNTHKHLNFHTQSNTGYVSPLTLHGMLRACLASSIPSGSISDPYIQQTEALTQPRKFAEH